MSPGEYAYHLQRFMAKILGICPALSLIISNLLQELLSTFLRIATSASNFLNYPMRPLISLDIAEIFEPILRSVSTNNGNNSCLLSLWSTASVCVPTISTTLYNLTKNKSIALLTRELAEKIVACNVLLCSSAICSG